MHPEDIKAELRKRYRTIKAFEQAKGLPVGSALDVIRGRSVRGTAVAIADCLGMPITAVFPGRFEKFRHHTSRKRDAHRLNQAAQ